MIEALLWAPRFSYPKRADPVIPARLAAMAGRARAPGFEMPILPNPPRDAL